MARAPVHLRCRNQGCRRKARTDRPVYDGRCRRCYLDAIGGYELVKTKDGRRCLFCDVLLHNVSNDGSVCLMGRCQTEKRRGEQPQIARPFDAEALSRNGRIPQ